MLTPVSRFFGTREASSASCLIMSIWDSLSGRKSARGEGLGLATAPDASSFFTEAALPDPSQLHPLAGLNQDTLDYITLEDSALDELPGSRSVLPSRGWSDDLCYGTGTTYLSALTLGGVWGLAEGLKRTPVTAPPKIRLNAVLNSITRRGPFLGNSAGVVAMVYNGTNSAIGYVRGKHDASNSIAAGALSGMLFKSTRGAKPMLISGGIVASIAGVWAVSRRIRTHFFLSPDDFFLSDTVCRSREKRSSESIGLLACTRARVALYHH